ncbi:hypothetical protein F4809DRAFT_658957 [Biscogniauxia mediterranea]|nr:hypothetical protein F4809DRAFT_658957 [Biscogniauxia mediterranea]
MPTTTITIADLPNEILLSILHLLGTVDPQCLLLSQRTSTRLRALARDVLFSSSSLSIPIPTTPHSNDRFLRARFAPLLDTAACFTPEEKARARHLSLDGDAALPFRRLPWARARRDAYLRPGASWRGLGLGLACGMAAPVSTLHVVRSYAAGGEGGPDEVAYGQVDGGGGGGQGGAGGITLGAYFDMLLLSSLSSREGAQGGDGVTYGAETGSWVLLPGRGLRSFDVLWEYECFIADDEELVVRDESAAILFVQGGRGCRGPLGREDAWVERLVEEARKREGGGLKLLPWQGPCRERRSEDEDE